jgi:membrane protease subunit HflC
MISVGARNKLIAGGVAAVIALVTISSALYTVSETEQVIITQFGRPIGQAITKPGLHAKLPFVQDLNVFDKRWLEWDGDANQLPTRDKKYIWVDTYARWRVADPLRFFQRLRDERGAHSRLDDIIDGETRNVIANHNLIEVVRSSNRKFEQGEEAQDVLEEEEKQEVVQGRDKITRLILSRASQVMPEFGIELVDVQIQRINYVDSVQTKVFERMVSERKRIADRHRSEGQGRSAEIRGRKERELKRIESEAYRKTQDIMGKADAQAAGIYAGA